MSKKLKEVRQEPAVERVFQAKGEQVQRLLGGSQSTYLRTFEAASSQADAVRVRKRVGGGDLKR